MKRDPYFDVLKFFAMFLVVFGHVYWAMGCKTGTPYFENFRCGMNMPLFFMISGYFAAHTIESGDWRKLVRHIFGYFWPLAVVSCVFAVLAVSFGFEGSDKGLIGYAGRNFLFGAWFLWCLAICSLLTFICFCPKRAVCRQMAFVLLLVVLPCVRGLWYVNSVRAMLPYFLLGAFVLRRWQIWKSWHVGLSYLILFVAGVAFQGNILENGLSFYTMETTWREFLSDGYAFPLFVLRLVNGFVGSIGVMWFLQVCYGRVKVFEKLAPFGMTTLWVYITHQWMLARVVDWGWTVPSFWAVLLCAVLLFAFGHMIGHVASRQK